MRVCVCVCLCVCTFMSTMGALHDFEATIVIRLLLYASDTPHLLLLQLERSRGSLTVLLSINERTMYKCKPTGFIIWKLTIDYIIE